MWPFSTSVSNGKDAIERKRAERQRLVSLAPSSLTAEHEQFLKVGAYEIVARIEKGEWTATEVMKAYIAQAAAAHLATNCATEILFEQALQQAEELDVEYARTKTLRGPFHGVPLSVKDQFDIAGYDTCIGFTNWTNKPATSNAVLVKQLISLGAIPLVKTNVPQTMFAFECNNPVWGRSTNPYNSKYTCGGSTGGEGALLAMDGSAIGIGSDIGGSLRIPAAYCGVYALKTTSGRLSRGGAQSTNPGFEGIKAVTGPMARTVKDLELFCRSLFGLEDHTHLDYSYVPMPYRKPVLPEQLKFGYYISDEFIMASPANRRAVLQTVEALKKQGHECVKIELPDVSDCLEIFLAIMSADGYRRMTSHLGSDPMDNSMKLPIYGARVPNLLRKLGVWIVERILGDSIFTKLIRSSRLKTVSETIEWSHRRDQWNTMFYEKVWNRYNLDGIICPSQALPQLPTGGATSVSSLFASTGLYNLVDSPVGIVPATRVDGNKDQLTEEWTSPSPNKRSILTENRLFQASKPMYNPVEMDGMPVSVQIVGRKWEDEKVVAMMSIIDDALGPRGFGPRGYATHVMNSQTK